MSSVGRNLCIFEMVTDANMKRLENNKETRDIFVGNIDCDISTSGIPIAVRDIWCLKCKRPG
jgi:hypothetical protein